MPELLSVVLPTHDRPRELELAARSLLTQTFTDLELVIVDDASADETTRVLDGLADTDKRVRVVRNSSPQGPCEARNRGLEVARGELVGFCDDDDTWLPGAAGALVEYLDSHRSTSAVSSWHEVHHVALGTTAVYRGPLDYGTALLLWQNFVALPFGIIRRSVLSFEVRFDPALPTGEDWDLWLRCSRDGPVHTMPRVCYAYTQHGGSRVTRTAGTQVEGRRNFLAKHGEEMPGACRLYHRVVLAGLENGRNAMLRELKEGHAAARDRLFVSMLLGGSKAASRLGQRRGDPGLQARLMAKTVERFG